MSDHNHDDLWETDGLPYIGPVWPITRDNFDRLNAEQKERFWWVATFVADQRDALTDLLWFAGVESYVDPAVMKALGL